MTKPGLPVIAVADLVIVKASGVGNAPDIEDLQPAGLTPGAGQAEIKPLVKIRTGVFANSQLDVVGSLTADYFDIAGVEILADMHFLLLSRKTLWLEVKSQYDFAVLTLLSLPPFFTALRFSSAGAGASLMVSTHQPCNGPG
jgi:hypothetical protein